MRVELGLVLAALVVFPGCQVGMLTTSPGEERTTYSEAGRGPEGAVLVESNQARPGWKHILVRGGEITRLQFAGSLEGAKPAAGFLYRRVGDHVLRSRVEGAAVREGEVVATFPGLRDFAVSRDGQTLLGVARDGVTVSRDGQAPRSIWQGDARTVAVDSEHGVAWIAARGPLHVLDRVRLYDGVVTLRVPLPVELDRGALDLVISGGNAAVYAFGRLDDAVLVWPDSGVATTLASLWAGRAPGVRDPESAPPIIVPPSSPRGERISVGNTANNTGVIAAYPGGRFLLIGRTPVSDNSMLAVIEQAEGIPGMQTLPEESVAPPWSVDSVSWDAEGVTYCEGSQLVRVAPSVLKTLDVPRAPGPEFRLADVPRYLARGVVMGIEAAVYLPFNVAFSGVVAPAAVFGVLAGNKACLPWTVAPLWWPWTYTFGIEPF